MEQIDIVTTIAKNIGDWGMAVIAAAFFLVLSAGLMVTCFKWFKSIINRIIERQDKMINELMLSVAAQGEKLDDIAEGFRPETQLRIKHLSSTFFDLSKEYVCRMIDKIREENHIEDRKATQQKIRRLLKNIHEDRDSKLDCFMYRGKRLSSYTSLEWIEKVALVVESEIYNDGGPNKGRAYTNVSSVYNDIKLDFYHNLNKD